MKKYYKLIIIDVDEKTFILQVEIKEYLKECELKCEKMNISIDDLTLFNSIEKFIEMVKLTVKDELKKGNFEKWMRYCKMNHHPKNIWS